MVRSSALAAAMLLALVAGAAAHDDGGGRGRDFGRGGDYGHGRGGDHEGEHHGGYQRKVTTLLTDLSAANADGITAGETLIITGSLRYYNGDGPSEPRTVTCTDSAASDVTGTGQAVKEEKFSVSIPNVVAGSRTFECSVPAAAPAPGGAGRGNSEDHGDDRKGGGKGRHLLQANAVYTAASATIVVLVEEGGTAAPTPTPSTTPIVAGTCDLDSQDSNQQPQTDCGVTGLRFRNFIVVRAIGAFEGTEADGSKVLTNAFGESAALRDRNGGGFDLATFYIANPNENSGLTVTITPTCATGSALVITLEPDQGPTLVKAGFTGCKRVLFVPAAGGNGRRLLKDNRQRGPRAYRTSFALDNINVSEAEVVASPPPSPPPVPPPSPPPMPPPSPPPVCERPRYCPLFQYRSDCGCFDCISEDSPFKKTLSNGETCVPPITLSGRSRTCSPVVLAAYIQGRRSYSRCLDPEDASVNVLFGTRRNEKYLDFFNKDSISPKSMRLDGDIAARGSGKMVAGRRLLDSHRGRGGDSGDDDFHDGGGGGGSGEALKLFTFVDTVGKLRGSRGQVVQVTGSIIRPNGPDFCFVSYLRVCRRGERPQ